MAHMEPREQMTSLHVLLPKWKKGNSSMEPTKGHLIQYLCNRNSISTPWKCCFMQLIDAILSSISKANSLKSMISQSPMKPEPALVQKEAHPNSKVSFQHLKGTHGKAGLGERDFSTPGQPQCGFGLESRTSARQDNTAALHCEFRSEPLSLCLVEKQNLI